MAKTTKGMTVKTVKNANANPQTPTGTGVQWLNGLDPNVAGLYNNAQQILQDNGAVNAYNQARDNGIQQANRQYNDNARSYYQMYKQNQSRLGDNLSRLGINGGASETASLGLLNNYSSNIYNNSQAKANAVNDINMRYDQLIAQNSADVAGQLANMYYNLGNGLLTERRQNERDDFVREQNQKFEIKMQERGWNREDSLNAYDRAMTQAQMTGDFSVMKKYGWTKSDISKANKLFASNNSSGGGGRSGGGGGYRYGGYGGSSGLYIDIPETTGETEENNGNPKKKKTRNGGSDEGGTPTKSNPTITKIGGLLGKLMDTKVTGMTRSNSAKELANVLSNTTDLTPQQHNYYWNLYLRYRNGGEPRNL